MSGKPGRSGGKRLGSGRKLGAVTRKVRAEVAEAAANGKTPLEFALAIMNNEKETEERRFAACTLAMPFVHPRLAMVAMQNDGVQPRQTGIRVEFVLPRGYSRDETSGQIVEHEPLRIGREPEGETEH